MMDDDKNENKEKDQKDVVAYVDRPDGLFIRSDSIIKLIDDSIESAHADIGVPKDCILGMEAIKELFLRDFDRINIKKMVG